jgi:hypothetical protein
LSGKKARILVVSAPKEGALMANIHLTLWFVVGFCILNHAPAQADSQFSFEDFRGKTFKLASIEVLKSDPSLSRGAPQSARCDYNKLQGAEHWEPSIQNNKSPSNGEFQAFHREGSKVCDLNFDSIGLIHSNLDANLPRIKVVDLNKSVHSNNVLFASYYDANCQVKKFDTFLGFGGKTQVDCLFGYTTAEQVGRVTFIVQ